MGVKDELKDLRDQSALTREELSANTQKVNDLCELIKPRIRAWDRAATLVHYFLAPGVLISFAGVLVALGTLWWKVLKHAPPMP